MRLDRGSGLEQDTLNIKTLTQRSELISLPKPVRWHQVWLRPTRAGG
jgi:hypothetical protein